jgi:hypothetical protein
VIGAYATPENARLGGSVSRTVDARAQDSLLAALSGQAGENLAPPPVFS